MSLKIVFMGTPDFAVPSLDILVKNGYDIVGVITPPEGEFETPVPDHMPVMGSYDSLEALLQLGVCQVVIVADDGLKSKTLMSIAALCEKEMVDFKLVPNLIADNDDTDAELALIRGDVRSWTFTVTCIKRGNKYGY